MAISITVEDVTTIHDETEGEQNTPPNLDSTENNNGNDVAIDLDSNDAKVPDFPSDFATRLTALGADPSGSIGAALSGYDGTDGSEGSNVLTIDPDGPTIDNLAFTDIDGNPLDGDQSGLYTVDGNEILLYTDTENDNIVLGIEEGTGDIVFAIYLDESQDLTSAKIWTIQYEAIAHEVDGDGTGGSYDDSLDLTDKLFVTASRDLEFDLTNAPSGQNLFIMFGDGDVTDVDTEVGIIATAKNPANESDGESITKGDTVNTSQGGGKTTFGVNNQMIDEGEGIYFTFVTGPEPNYTVPNLDQNEADIEANIQFDDFLGSKSAEFQVVQLQGGKTADVKISAFNETEDPFNESGEGVSFVDGLNNDDVVAITDVQVFESDGVTPAAGWDLIDHGDGTFTITGVEAGDIIKYSTDGDHNRVLIENNGDGKGQDSADFDIGGFRLVQGDVTTVEVGSTVHWEDDGPQIDLILGAGMLHTHDGDLENGIGGDGVGTDTDSAGLGDLFTVTELAGADGDAGTVYSLQLGANTETTVVDSVTDETVILSLTESGVVEGRTATSGELVFTLSVDSATGEVTLEQWRAIEHTNLHDTVGPYTDELTIGLGVSDAVNLSATITDGDGDTATDSIDISGTICFSDNGPTIDLTLGDGILQTDDGDLAGGNGGDGIGTDTDSAGLGDLFTVTELAGADGDAGTVYSLQLGTNTTTSLVDSVTDETVVLSLTESGVVEGRTATSGELVFTLSVDSATGGVTLTQLRAVEHATTDTASPYDGDITGLGVSDAVNLSATITDGDGDTATDSIDISDRLQFTDDGPQAGSTTAATLDDEGLSGIAGNGESSGDAAGELTTTSGTLNHDFGADGAGSIHFASLDGTTDTLGTETVTYTWDDASNTLTAASARGVVLTVVVTDPATGAYSVTLNQPVLHAAETAPGTENDATLALTYTVVDADGDAAAGTLNINIDDDTPAIDFSNLVGTVTTTTQSGFWAGSAGADQPGTLTVAVEDTDLQADGIQFDMVTAGGTPSTGTVSSFSFDSETGIGTGTLTADFDNNAQNGDESVNFTLTVNEDGSYEFTLDRVIQPVVTLSTDEGQLAAGGPDSVQTLTFGQGEATTSIVFFAADADTAVSGGIGPAILLGEDDLTEAQLEARAAAPIGDGTFPFIREEIEMNVSGTGIGVNNNVLQGEDLPGDAPGTINSFDSGAFDESFVVNPEALSSSVTVYISKTAGGFLPPNEDGTLQGTAAKTDYLYINIYDEEGNSIGPILITSDMVFDEADVAAGGTGENLWSFTIDIDDLPLDGDYIDAIQFTMGFGDIKIPKIEVVARGNEPANDISLDFSATLTDADGDSTTTDFAIDLDGNDVITETQFFDYTLVDAGDTNSNAFNVDLSSDLTEFLVTGFDNTTDDDKLLLLGDAGGTVSIDNSGDDSIVTVEESGGQITRITVDGVDLVQDDVVLVGDGEEDLLLLQDLESTNDPKATNSYETDQVFSVSLTSSDSESSDSSAKNQNLITEDYITSEDTLF